MKRRLHGTALLFFLALAGSVMAQETSAPPLYLGIYPMAETTRAVKMFTPLANYLGTRTGRAVEIEVAPDYAEQLERIGQDRYDLAYVGPANYVRLLAKYGPRPLLARLETNGSPVYRGAIIARNDSPISALQDLRGKRMVFGHKGSTMGYLVPRHMLWKAGIDLKSLGSYGFLPNQEDVALSVLAGIYDAGAVRQQIFDQFEARGLKAVVWSPLLSEHVFVASSKLDPKTRQALAQALLDLSKAPGGFEILAAIQRSATGFVPASESDYEAFKGIIADTDKLEAAK